VRVGHLLQRWPQVAGRLKSGPKIALFLDFDGTLARLRSLPQDVSLDRRTRRALAVLAHNRRFQIWIVSGRRQADIRARIRVPGIRYLGLYGWEGSGTSHLSEKSRQALICVKVWIASLLLNTPGVWIEDKESALAIHHRGAADSDVRRARKIVRGVIEPFAEVLKLTPGKKIWEVMPLEIQDKGAAVRRELAAQRDRAVPVYVGDDAGDEPAFEALASRGITVRVGPARTTRARYYLDHVRQVRVFLEQLGSEFA
jgi:trehalose 6-phosphate phosphatase